MMVASPVKDLLRRSATVRRPEPQTWFSVQADGCRVGDAGVDGGLACRVLALSGGQHLTEYHFVDLVTGDLNTGFFQWRIS